MRKLLAIIPALAMLSGCGGGEDFSVEVKRPIAAVMSPYLAASISEAKGLFPGISFQRTRPSDHELLFAIPGSGSSESTIRLRFEPVRNGEGTVVHATVDVPPVRATIDGVEKRLSEAKVEDLLKRQIESTGRALEAHETPDSYAFSGQLVGLAIATNPLFLQRAMELKNNPEKLAAALMAFTGAEPAGNPRPDDPSAAAAAAAPMDHPEYASRAEDAALGESQRREERQLEAASAPMDNPETAYGD